MPFSDTFTAANGTLLTSRASDSGHTWAAHGGAAGQFEVQSNRIRCSTAGACVSSYSPTSVEFDVEFDYYISNATAGTMGVIFRADPTAITWYMVRHTNTQGWELFKFITGTSTQLDTSGAFTPTNGTTYAVRVEVRSGGAMAVYIDDVLTLEATDTAITAAGRVGVRDTVTGSNSGRHVATLTVTEVVSAAPVVNAGADATITTADPLSRTATFTDADSSGPYTATVDYGKGAGPQAVTPGAGTVPLSASYPTAGVYTVTVAVTDDAGSTGTDSFQLTVNEAPTVGQFIVASVVGTDASAPVIVLT